MKKILALLFCICFIFCSCNNQEIEEKEDIKINLPNDNSVNGYRIITENDKNYSEYSYCGNKNSKKFHKSDCKALKNTKTKNKVYFNTKEEFLSNNYTACKLCNP